MAETELVCANRECRIAQGGKCVEGHDDLAKCLYYGKEGAIKIRAITIRRQLPPSTACFYPERFRLMADAPTACSRRYHRG